MTILKAEPWIFRLLVLLHLWPVFAVDYFVTHDGPAHVYNSALIRDMLFTGNNTAAEAFFEFNAFPHPNWTGHALMLLAGTVFSPAFSEKVLIAICIILPAFSFRAVILQLSPGSGWRSWTIFPFLHGFLLYLGFYNFCLGTGILLFSVAWWQKHKNSGSTGKAIIFASLMLLLYFSHLFTLLMFLVYLFISTMRERIAGSRFPTGRLAYYAGIILPVLLSVFFVIQLPSSAGTTRDASELAGWILDARPVITLNYEEQQPFTLAIGVVSMFMFMITIAYRVMKERSLKTSDAFFLSAMISLIFYFTLPDSAGEGGFISVRFLLFFYLFALIWIALNPFKKWMLGVANLVFIAISIKMLFYHHTEMQKLSAAASSYTAVSDQLRPGSIVLPLNYSDNWLHSNLSGYVGAEASVLMLDNYEAAKSVFPLRWREGMDPYKIIGGFSARIPPCGDASGFQKATADRKIDHILQWKYAGQADSCTLAWMAFFKNEGYAPKQIGENMMLYSR